MERLPDNVVAYKRTPVFEEDTVPEGLLQEHTTKPAVWGRIVVLEGRLRYTIHEPAREVHVLEPGHEGIIAPAMKHEILPLGRVRFYIEFNK
ncbi:MAG TPA: DUF1971 domain-containing protein [Candidatus Desulfobacillus sp.]|nr:DUF1971 domain-containing protein [Candidatus Desulfobacillus sp.]